jgi:hypothetical protein
MRSFFSMWSSLVAMKVWMRARGAFFRASAAREMSRSFARQGTNGGLLDVVGNGLDRFKVAIAGGSKARFDHVHAQALELPGDAQLFVARHGGSRRLFAIAQGGVEDDELVGHGRLLGDVKMNGGCLGRSECKKPEGAVPSGFLMRGVRRVRSGRPATGQCQ